MLFITSIRNKDEWAMKKGIYIYCKGDNTLAGVEKKIDMQIRVFSESFEMHRIVIRKENTTALKLLLWRCPFGSYGRDYEQAIQEIHSYGDIDFFYIRYIDQDKRAYDFLKSIRMQYPKSVIVMELASYPYKGELLANKTMWPFYFKDALRAKKAAKLIDRFTSFSSDHMIREVPVINISNGIIVDDVNIDEMITESDHAKEHDEIRLLVVAQMQIHHGYERVIRGLSDYYRNGGDRKIFLDMVGGGTEREHYEKLVNDLKLEHVVTFYGSKQGEELKSFYRKADIGLGSFGFYKIRLNRSSVLKMREYLAYGLPVISACEEDFIREGETCKYYLHFPNDDSTVDIGRILAFYDRLCENENKSDIRQEIHQYAKEHVDMKVVLTPLIEYLEGALQE